MRRLPRENPELDFVRLMSRSPRFKTITDYSEVAIREFGDALAGLAHGVVAHEKRLAGIRAEAVFQAVVTGIGDVLLIKEEDEGDVFFDEENVVVPDFRIVLRDRRQVLVEVKRVSVDGDPTRRFSLADANVQGLHRYAELTGGKLYFALFWEDLGRWTLNSLDAMKPGASGSTRWSISLARAFVTNEMLLLGDCEISTAPPLRFRILVDGENSEPMPRGAGDAKIVVAGIQLLSEDRVLTGISLRIGWILMWFGDWQEWEPEHKEVDGKLVYIDYPVGPPEYDGTTATQVPMIGSLSKVISRCYLESAKKTVHTTSTSEILQPGFMGEQFIPADWVARKLDIPISKFFVKPNFDPRVVSAIDEAGG